MKLTNFFSLNAQDFVKGLVVAVIGGLVAFFAPAIQSGQFSFDWTTIWHTAVASAVAYLAKNLLSPTPKTIQIDPSQTSVVDKTTKETIIQSNKN